jgi:HAE1 family hydrophobic/amphiphilic exporter-1
MQGIKLFFLENKGEGVSESLGDLLKAGLFGALLSLLVLYFFLRSIQTTLMVSLAVPIAITITLGVMYFLGLSLNILSMMGLMLAVGMLVDNAVVVSESIHTEHEKTPDDPKGSALRGVSAVGLAVAAGTVTSAAVFLPIIFGEKDQISIFMTHVAVAIVVSLVVSLFIAQTIIPLLASRIDRPASSKQNAIVDRIKERYVRLLHWNMRHRWLAAAMVILTLVSAAIPMSIVETDMFPQDQTRQLYLNFNLDGSYPLAKLKESVDRIEDYLYGNQELFEIRAVYTYYSEQGDAMSVILLKDDDEAERSAHEISTDIMDGLPKIAIGQPAFGFDRVGGGEKLNITLTGSSSKILQELGDDAVRILSSVEGLTGVVSAASAGDQEVQVRVDRERANQLGFSTQEVAQAVSIAIRGNCVNSRVRRGRSR